MTFDIPSILERLGYPITIRGENCVVPSNFRGGDNPLAVFVNSSGVCYDQVQNRTFKLVEFVAEVLGGTIAEAQKFINSNQSAAPEIKEPKIELAPQFDITHIQNLTESFDFYYRRGITKETLQTFKAGFCHGGRYNLRVVFPIFEGDKIIGAAARDVANRDPAKKWVVSKKERFVYPLFLSEKYIKETKCLVLVESVGDMLKLWQSGIRNVLVTFGVSLSKTMERAILMLNPSRILIGLNNDTEKEFNRGQIGAEKIRAKLSKWFSNDKIINAPPKQGDFGENSESDIGEWAKKYNVRNFK